jgi:hypothetical protein
MTEEDEAFEDLAKRQGDWGMQGSRKHQIMRYAENVENKGTSMTDKEAMKLAIFALDIVKIHYTQSSHINEAIAALKERLAQPEPIQSLQCAHCQVTIETLNDKVMQLMAQRTEPEPEPVAWIERDMQCDDFDPDSVTCEKPTISADGWEWVALYTHPPQRTEQNFCPRCGKRTNDIHTCTPPQENT